MPLLWLAMLPHRAAAWWGIAAAFGISWVADSAAHWMAPWLVSAVYPVSQAALVGLVLLPRVEAAWFIGALVLVGIVAVLTNGTNGPDRLLHTVAWLSIVGLLARRPSPFQRLALAFAALWLAWIAYALSPGWPTWLVFQGMRLGGILAFCRIAWKPPLALRIA